MDRMRQWITLAFLLVLVVSSATTAQAKPGVVTLVDGTQMTCDILFVHPNAPLLIVRSAKHMTLQSLPLSLVHTVAVDGQSKTHSARRALSKEEKVRFERDGLWGEEAGPGQIGRYAQEKWEAKPAIIWAKPGESGDAMEAGGWLDETGAVLTQSPWSTEAKVDKLGRKQPDVGSFDGDVLLPEAEKEYQALQRGNRDHLGAFEVRHLTVEANASYQIRYSVLGNMWIKDGAKLGSGTQTGGMGSADSNKHTFARFGNYHGERQPTWAYAPGISHWVWIDTGDTGSLEVIGQSGGAGDRLTLRRGTLVVAKDSYIGNGNRGSFYTQAGTTAILLDGARVGCPDPLISSGRSTYGISGTLMFGTPERPLTRDLDFGACYFPKDKLTPTPSLGQRTSGASFVLGQGGRMVVHSSDPTKARVIFGPRDRNLPVSQYMVPKEMWQYTKRVDKAATGPSPELWTQPGIPTGITAVFIGDTDFNGVVFDGFYEGGIHVTPEARKKWRNVSFGEHNQAAPDKLFVAFP